MAEEQKAQSFTPGYLEESNAAALYAVNTIILALSVFLLCLRLYARSLTNAKRGWDEFLLPPSWLLLLGLIIINYIAIPNANIGKHLPVAMMKNPDSLKNLFFFIYVLDWFYVPSNMLSRVAVVLLYLRIFTSKFSRVCCWIVLVFLVGNCLATIIAAQVECRPLQLSWDKKLEGTCFDQMLWWKLTNFPNVIADVAILLLPIKTIIGLKASPARKAGIWGVCLTGSIGLIASCVRTSQFYVHEKDNEEDPTYTGCPLLVYTVLECGMYFCAACLVGLRPLFSRMPACFRRYTSVYNRSRKPTGGYSEGTKLGTVNATHISKRKDSDTNDAASTTHIVPYGNRVDVAVPDSYSLGPDLECDITEPQRIHVETRFEVNTSPDRARHGAAPIQDQL